jgi:myo-inositol-1(or 4)-monophosphatase
MPTTPTDLLKTAMAAAKLASNYLLSQSGKLSTEQIREKAANDFVTEVDHTSESMIIERIRQDFPDHHILAEESGATSADGNIQWIIDPLDGTLNYIRKIPFYAVSIAAKQGNQLLAGVVFNPAQQEYFHAIAGGGAFLNDVPIHVSKTDSFSKAFLATGFPHQRKRMLPPYSKTFNEILHASAGMRRIGSAALDMCYTACGRFDGYWELGLHPWDIAAGTLLIKEAGGIVSDFKGTGDPLENGYVIAANNKIHRTLHNIIQNHFMEIIS